MRSTECQSVTTVADSTGVDFRVVVSEFETTKRTSLRDKLAVPVGVGIGDTFSRGKIVTTLVAGRHTGILLDVSESGDVENAGTSPETASLSRVAGTLHVARSFGCVFTSTEVKVLVGTTETV